MRPCSPDPSRTDAHDDPPNQSVTSSAPASRTGPPTTLPPWLRSRYRADELPAASCARRRSPVASDDSPSVPLRGPWGSPFRTLCLDAELVHPAARKAYVFSYGQLRPLPPQLMGVPTDVDAVARSGILSPAGLDRLRDDQRRPAGPLTGADPAIGHAIESRLGAEVLDRLVDPMAAHQSRRTRRSKPGGSCPDRCVARDVTPRLVEAPQPPRAADPHRANEGGDFAAHPVAWVD